MAQRLFLLEYEFCSSKADGSNYTLRLEVKANSMQGALSIAQIEGFRAFGARFNDNCVDWRVVQPQNTRG